MIEAAIAFAAVILLVFVRIPIAFSMALVGTVGFVMARGWEPAFFILMGVFVGRAGMSEKLYSA